MKISVIQAAPIPFAVDAGLAKAHALAADAIAAGAGVVAFGETFIGGYPIWLDEAPAAALWDHPGTKALHRILLDQAIRSGDPRLADLQALADASGALISIGVHERRRSSLYNNQLLIRPKAPPLDHRKLVPTHGERLVWARGDGSTLAVHAAPWGKVGSLICWEHWMPLARAAMHAQQEAVHIACWPTVREIHAIASRHYAFEGRCFVLAAGLVQWRDDLLDGLQRAGGDADAAALLATIPDGQRIHGRSLIAAPDGRILAQAGTDEETIFADIDLGEITASLGALDTDGHYSRPDVFELQVDAREKDGVVFGNGAAKPA
ncbi:MAG: carbon-nitrogen hydrolase family protein [Sphingopyxis sp.]|nr:carbon-nitrogen hydrolase family protein [Sphingopyxis sp.]